MKRILIFFLTITSYGCSSSLENSNDKGLEPLEHTILNELNENHHSIYTSIIINAPMKKVWEAMTDFETMPGWSSTLQSINGNNLDHGESVHITFKMNGKDEIIPHKLIYSKNNYYGWSDTLLLVPGIVDKHLYKVEKVDSLHSRFVQSDEFKGENPNINTLDLTRYVLPMYLTFNRELKEEVEKRLKKSTK